MKKIFKIIVLPIVFSTSSAFAAKLFFLEKGKGDCSGKFIEIPSKKETPIFSMKSCPGNLVWEMKSKTLFYTLDNHLFSRSSLNPNEKAKMISILPQKEVSLSLDNNGKPQIAYLVQIPDKDVKLSGEGETRKEIYQFEGKSTDASNTESWGLPYMAISAKLENGKWVRTEMKPTKSDAGETLGLSALDDYKSFGLTLESLLEKTWCAKRADSDCSSEDLQVKKILKLKNNDDTYGAGAIKTKSGHQFIFKTAFGDSLHAVPPVYFLSSLTSKGKKLNLDHGDQIAISKADDFVLIATEYGNEKVHVYDGSNGNLIYENKNSLAAAWFP